MGYSAYNTEMIIAQVKKSVNHKCIINLSGYFFYPFVAVYLNCGNGAFENLVCL